MVPVDKTVDNKTKLLHILVNSYGLDLQNPDPETVVANITKARISARSMKTYKTVFKQWLQSRGIEISDKVKAGLKHRNGQRVRITHPNDLVSREELSDIIEHTTSQVLKTYLLVLYDTAGRPRAVCKLDISDVTQDKYGFILNFRHVKTEQSQRPVRLIDPLAIRHLEIWLSIHPRNKESDAPWFLNRLGRRFRVESVLSILRAYHNERLGRGNGGKASLSPYLFRKSRATQLLRERLLSDVEVRQRLGHNKDSRILESYYDIRDEQDQQKAELRAMGIVEVENKPSQRICPNCSMLNEAAAAECLRCRHPLTEEAMIKQQRAAIESVQQKTALETIKTLLSDPKTFKVLASAFGEALANEKRAEKKDQSKADETD